MAKVSISILDQILNSNTKDQILESKSLDYQAATVVSRTILTACSFHSSPSSANRSSHYDYANNPGLISCSSPQRASNNSSPMICVYSLEQPNCPLYTPDFTVVSKVKTNLDCFYYLSRFRTYNGSYVYRIYDSFFNVYSNFDYTNLSVTPSGLSDLDLEAIKFYKEFLSHSGITYSHEDIDDDCSFRPIQKKAVSYLNALVSKD
jgi:hypothetical protein